MTVERPAAAVSSSAATRRATAARAAARELVARGERVGAETGKAGERRGAAHSNPIMARTSAGDLPARRSARKVTARFRFARRTPLASVMSA